jgi:hypothetical protein
VNAGRGAAGPGAAAPGAEGLLWLWAMVAAAPGRGDLPRPGSGPALQAGRPAPHPAGAELA